MNICRPLIISIFCVFSLSISATEQIPERLIYKSDTLYINIYPLENYLNSDTLIRKRLFNFLDTFCLSSGCHRGYIGTWKIENNKLYLIDLENGCEDFHFDLLKVFGKENIEDGKILADWFSGTITAAFGDWILFDVENWTDIFINSFECKVKSGAVENVIINKLTDKQVDSLLINDSNKSSNNNDTTIYLMVDTFPALITPDRVYEMQDLKCFIRNNLRYPQNGMDYEGSVFVSFVVEKDGTISNKKFLRKLCKEYDEEAMKVIDLMTNWKPGMKNGVPVRTLIILPLRYR